MSRAPRASALWPLLILVAGPLPAQSPRCEDSDTITQCWSRFFPPRAALIDSTRADSAETASTAGEVAALSVKNNGIASLGNELASAVSDFLPSIAGALGFTQATTENGSASFEKNLLLPFGAKPQRFRLRALLRAPAIYAPLADTLTTLGLNAREEAVGKQLRDYDDARLSLAWNLENGTFGRSFEEFRAAYSHLFDEYVKALNTVERNRAVSTLTQVLPESVDQIRDDRLTDHACIDPIANQEQENVRLDCLKPGVRQTVITALESAARATAQVEANLATDLKAGGFHEFNDLIDNQPQLSLEASTDIRRDLVGPNEFHAAVRYEGGFANVNGLRQYCRSKGPAGLTPDCLRQYLESPGVRPTLQRSDRFYVVAEFSRRSDFTLVVPEDSLRLTAKGTWDLTGTAGFGRYVAFDRSGEGVGRLDLAAEYVHHQDDDLRENRLLITGTYTQRLSGSLSVAAGFSYSNRPEFVGDVDKKVSANFGLRYKLTKE